MSIKKQKVKSGKATHEPQQTQSLLLEEARSITTPPGWIVEGDRGVGDRERGWQVYGRQEQREWKAGFPRWREAGEKGNNYATLCNILQSKKCKEAGANKYRAGTGIKGYGKREV